MALMFEPTKLRRIFLWVALFSLLFIFGLAGRVFLNQPRWPQFISPHDNHATTGAEIVEIVSDRADPEAPTSTDPGSNRNNNVDGIVRRCSCPAEAELDEIIASTDIPGEVILHREVGEPGWMASWNATNASVFEDGRIFSWPAVARGSIHGAIPLSSESVNDASVVIIIPVLDDSFYQIRLATDCLDIHPGASLAVESADGRATQFSPLRMDSTFPHHCRRGICRIVFRNPLGCKSVGIRLARIPRPSQCHIFHVDVVHLGRSRSFSPPPHLRPLGSSVLVIATRPQRIERVEDAINSAYPFVDAVSVMLNNYEGVQIPSFLLNDPKIHLGNSSVLGDRGPAGRFFHTNHVHKWRSTRGPGVDNSDGRRNLSDSPDVKSGNRTRRSTARDYDYTVTLDDDISLPADFAARLTRRLRCYGNAVVLGCHCCLVSQPMDSRGYYTPGSRRCRTMVERVGEDHSVHFIGSGIVVFHTSTFGASYDDFFYKAGTDVTFSLYAHDRGIPLMCAARPENWVISWPVVDRTLVKSSVYESMVSGEISSAIVKNNLTLHPSKIVDNMVRAAWPISVGGGATCGGVRRRKFVLGVLSTASVVSVQRCLESFAATRSSGFDWVVIIADDGASTDMSSLAFNIYRRMPSFGDEVHVINTSGLGTAAQSNAILEMSMEIRFDYGVIVHGDAYFGGVGWDVVVARAVNVHPLLEIILETDSPATLKAPTTNSEGASPEAGWNRNGRRDDTALPVVVRVRRGSTESRDADMYSETLLWSFTPHLIDRIGYVRENAYGWTTHGSTTTEAEPRRTARPAWMQAYAWRACVVFALPSRLATMTSNGIDIDCRLDALSPSGAIGLVLRSTSSGTTVVLPRLPAVTVLQPLSPNDTRTSELLLNPPECACLSTSVANAKIVAALAQSEAQREPEIVIPDHREALPRSLVAAHKGRRAGLPAFDAIYVLQWGAWPGSDEHIDNNYDDHEGSSSYQTDVGLLFPELVPLSRRIFGIARANNSETNSAWRAYFNASLSIPAGTRVIENECEFHLDYDNNAARAHFVERKHRWNGTRAIPSHAEYTTAAAFLNIVKNALLSEFDRILVLDADDVRFSQESIAGLVTWLESAMWDLPTKWKLVRLGTRQRCWGEGYAAPYSNNFFHPRWGGHGSFPVAVDHAVYGLLIDQLSEMALPLDVGPLHEVARRYPSLSFAAHPGLGWPQAPPSADFM